MREKRRTTMQRQRFPAGATIFSAGDPSDRAYLVRSGRVEILKRVHDGNVRLALLGDGDIVGEMGLLDERPRSATARAIEPVVADAISQAEFTHLLLHEPQHAIELLRALFERLRTMNQMVIESTTASVPHVVLLPASPETRAAMPAEGIHVTRFPFRVGRAPETREASLLAFNELALPDQPPYVLALSHFALDLGSDGVVVRERGSQHGTIVDGTRIGALARRDTAPLHAGRNEIVAGAPPLRRTSPFLFTAVVETS